MTVRESAGRVVASDMKTSVSLSSATLRARTYRPDVDGLRSLAILSVVLYHAGVNGLSGGFTGVDIFFAISGYLIGGHISTEIASGVFRFSNFYRNRAKRILPALYVVLAGVTVAGAALLSPREFRELGKYLFATTASISNIMLWRTTGYFAPRADLNPLLMTWSLGVEEQFYLVIPLLLVLISRVRKQLVFWSVLLISVVSFLVACYQVKHDPNSAFYLLTSRTWELGAGVLLAIFEVEGRRWPALQTNLANNIQAWAGLALLSAPFFLLSRATPFPGAAALPSVAGAVLLLSSNGAWVNRRLLSLAPLVFVGRVSYSFYLLHWPLLAFLRVLSGGPLPKWIALAAVVVAFGLAVLSYLYVEKPFRSSKQAAGRLLVRYGVVSLALLMVSGLIYWTKGMHWRYEQAGAIDNVAGQVLNTTLDACFDPAGESAPRLAPECTGVHADGYHVALWGDSHAAAMASTLRSASARQGYFMEEYAKTSCPPLEGAGRAYRPNPALLGECIRFNNAVLHRLVASPQVKIVLLVAYWDGSFDPHFTDEGKLAKLGHDPRVDPGQAATETLMRSSLTATTQALVAAGKQVVVFSDTPLFDIDPVWRMRTRAIPLRWRLTGDLEGGDSGVDPGADQAFDDSPPQEAGQKVLRQTVASLPGVFFWDLRSHLCDTNDSCPYREGDTPLFADTNHLTPAGSRKSLAGWTLPALTVDATASPR